MSVQIDALRAKLQRMLAEEFGTIEVDDDGDLTLHHESARAFIRCHDWIEDQTIVAIEAPILVDVPLSPALYEYVATEGGNWIFGHVLVQTYDDGTSNLMFKHNLLGDFLDSVELKRAVIAVLGTANDLDEQLQARFGGRRFHEGA